MSVLIVPCYIKTGWDLACLSRLLRSVAAQRVPFEHVFLVDDASPLRFVAAADGVDHIRLESNGGPGRARNVGIDRALATGAQQDWPLNKPSIPTTPGRRPGGSAS